MNVSIRRHAAALMIFSALFLTGCMEAFEVPDKESPGGKAFVKQCSLCHALPNPTRMTFAKWEVVVERMRKNIRSQNVPPMPEEVRTRIIEYLRRNALPESGTEATPPPEVGAVPNALLPLFAEAGIAASEKHLMAPNFTLPTLEGGEARLSDFSGKLVLINFWATWCRPCREEMPALMSTAAQYKASGLTVLAISLDPSGKTDVIPFMAGYDADLPVLLDPKSTVGNAYGVRVMPTTYLIGRDGVVVGRKFGAHPWDNAPTRALIESLLTLA